MKCHYNSAMTLTELIEIVESQFVRASFYLCNAFFDDPAYLALIFT